MNEVVTLTRQTAQRFARAVEIVERSPLFSGTLPGETRRKLFDGGFSSADDPWEIFQWTPPSGGDPTTYWRNVRVHLGYVNSSTTTAETKVHELDPLLPTGSAAGSVYDILVPASTTAYKIWGKVVYTRLPYCSQQEGSVAIISVIIEHGTDWWTGHPGQYAEAGVFYFEIGTVTTGVDSPQWLDEPTNTVPNPAWRSLTINQIAASDQTIITSPVLFVTLSNDGGAAGDKDTACTFTYQATDLCGQIVGATLAPQNSRARILNAPTNAATRGTVYWDADGALQLWDCNETLAQYACPEEGDPVT